VSWTLLQVTRKSPVKSPAKIDKKAHSGGAKGGGAAQPPSSEAFFAAAGSAVAPRPAAAADASAPEAARPGVKTACVTTDFSMQNVMMQMGLSVVSVDGMLIRAAKQWVLRCMACFKVSCRAVQYPTPRLHFFLSQPPIAPIFTSLLVAPLCMACFKVTLTLSPLSSHPSSSLLFAWRASR